jgi:hypothetical protein
MKAQGPKSMVSPAMLMLSVFITPWMKPTFIHCASSAACRSATARSHCAYRSSAPQSSGSWRAMA